MQTRAWLEAHAAGKVVHDWNPIEIQSRGKVLRLLVSTDAPRILYPGGDRVRESAGAHATQSLADALGALMTTPAIREHRHLAATVRIRPALASLIKKGGTVANTTAREASRYIDRQVQLAEDARLGPWLISPVGKGFVLTNDVDDDTAANFGWHVSAESVIHRPHDGTHWWLGVQVYPALLIGPGYFYIQRHTDLGHGLHQDDYASFGDFVAEEGNSIDGHPVRASQLYTDPALCHFVTHDNTPLKWTRHPGVELAVEIRTDPPPLSDTSPHLAALPWRDERLTHGQRKVLWIRAQRDAGVCEDPAGSNNGPEISEYHAITVRDGVPGFGGWLAEAGGNWCASSASAADFCTRLPSDPGPHMTPRAAGWEIERDAKADGTWRPTELAISGAFEPEPGDTATMQRGEPGSGLRHVITVMRNDRPRGGVWGCGGNEGWPGSFGPDTFYRYAQLLGFREVPDDTGPRYEGVIPYQGEDVPVEAEPIYVNGPPTVNPLHFDGDNVLVEWGPVVTDPDGWRGVEGSDRRWRVTAAGIQVKGEAGPRRTKGEPITARRIYNANAAVIGEATRLTGVPVPTILAMLATESGGNARAARFEKHLEDWSLGMAQTLTETAWAMARQLHVTAPRLPIPRGGTKVEWETFLYQPRNSVLTGCAYLDYNNDRWKLGNDPVLAYAAYNAGSPRVRLERPWGVHYFSSESYDALDVFAAWYGDACAVLYG